MIGAVIITFANPADAVLFDCGQWLRTRPLCYRWTLRRKRRRVVAKLVAVKDKGGNT